MLLRPFKTPPLVSILVACYNAEGFVRRAIESALAQTYPRLEIIVAPDDGKRYDALRQWCNSPRVRVLTPEREVRTGAAAARNRAIDAAEGDFLLSLAA